MKTKISVSLFILILTFAFLLKNSFAQGWRFQTIDSEGSVGSYCSIAIDTDGYPRICYYYYRKAFTWGFNYAYKDSTGWHYEKIDETFAYYTSISIDQNGNSHVAYYDDSDLRYAYRIGNSWSVEVIDSYGETGKYASLALDNENYPHICYTSYYNDRQYLRHSWKDESGWHKETITSCERWSSDNMIYCSISLDALNLPYIVFFKYDDLYLSKFDGSNWQITLLKSNIRTKRGTSIEIDKKTDKICIAAGLEQNLEYGENNGSGWSWTPVDTYGEVGYYPSIVLDHLDYPHISYYDFGNKDVKYAYQDQSGWHVQTVASQGNVGNYVDLSLNCVGEPHICYYDDSDDDLIYAYPAAYGPQAFSLIAPANGSWVMPTPEFRWYSSSYQGDGLSHYELWIDNNLEEGNIPKTRPFITIDDSLTDGWHYWKVRAALSGGGEIWSTESWSMRVDLTPPTTFNLLSPNNNSWTNTVQPTLAWQASSDAGSGLLKYQLFVDGSLNRDDISPTVTSTTPSWNLPDGDHFWYIVAVDNAQNKTQSNQTWTIKIDTTSPNNFLLSSPANNSWTGNATPTFSWNSTTDNGIGLSKYQLIIDGGVIIDSISTGITSVTLSTSQALIEGSHGWKIKAFDLLGNSIETNQWTLKVDLTPPNSFSLSLPADSGAVNFPTPNFSWNATTDVGSGLSHYQLWIDNNLNIDNLTTTTTAPSAPLGEGSHKWFVKAIDYVGNERTSQQRTIFCDWTIPAVFDLVSPANGSVVMVAQPTLSWQASNDAISGLKKYQLWINGLLNRDNIAASNTSTTPVSSLANGNYTWFIKAFDKADNSISSTSTWQFTVNRDVTAPSSVITSPSNNAVVGGDSLIVTGTATDGTGSGIQKVEVSTNGGANWSLAVNMGTHFSTWQYIWRGYTSGTYNIKSRATDLAENIEAPSPGITVTVSLAKPAVQTIEVLPPYAKTGQVTIKVVFQPNASEMDNSVNPTVTFKPAGSTTSEAVIQQSYSGNTWIGIGNVTQAMNNGNATIAVSGAQNSLGNLMAVNTNAGQFVIDTTPPSSIITYPASGATISSATVTITGTSTDVIGVDSVKISTDGGQTWKLTTNTGINFSTWSYMWAGYVNGNYVLKSRAFDKALNAEIPGAGVPVTVLLTGVSEHEQAEIPTEFMLGQNYPNPFNPETIIEYQLPKSCYVMIKIYNMVGQEIKTLIDEKREAGYHQIIWNGKDNLGRLVVSGIYLYQIKTEEFVSIKKMALLQ